jgi:hypothetical protein
MTTTPDFISPILSPARAGEIADLFAATKAGILRRYESWQNKGYDENDAPRLKDKPDFEHEGGISPTYRDAGYYDKSGGFPKLGTDYPYVAGPYSYLRYPVLVEAVADLEDGWQEIVQSLINLRLSIKVAKNKEEAAARLAAHKAKVLAAHEAIEHSAIRAYVVPQSGQRGYDREPQPVDCSWMAKLASSSISTNKRYEPEPGCKAVLHLKQGLSLYYVQDAYADLSSTAIPVTIEEGADMAVCKRNLARFAAALKTHNGFAGSGSTWSLDLIERPEGVFVLAAARHSISD